MMSALPPDGGRPSDGEGRGWDGVGTGGSGPDFVEVVVTATPGSIRVYTANAGSPNAVRPVRLPRQTATCRSHLRHCRASGTPVEDLVSAAHIR